MRFTRRQMVLGLLGMGACSVLPRRGWAAASDRASPFESDRRRTLAAAAERVLPGAGEAGVPDYIDWWMQKPPFDRYIRRLFNVAAAHLDRVARRTHRMSFDACSPEQQDAILKSFQTGEFRAKNFNSRLFFEHFVRFTLEGFLCEPDRYGGNRNGVGWKFIGREKCWWQPRHLDLTLDPKQGLPY